MQNLYAIILAAGNSSRYGSPKQLAHWNGGTLLQHTIDRAETVCQGRVLVVLGAGAEEIYTTLPDNNVMTVFNPIWQEGMASSIRTGIGALPAAADAALIMVCDQPLIRDGNLAMLAACWHDKPESIVASDYNQTQGVPVIFPRSLFNELLRIDGDRGARQVIYKHTDRLETIPVPEAGLDIDTRADMQQLPGTQ